MEKPLIQLFCFEGIGVIVSCQSGVRYSNQTGGYACLFPEIEGVFAPLTNLVFNQREKLNKFFTGTKWGGYCYKGIDEETADFIDSVLIESPQTEILRVDREKLRESHEAWIYVLILEGRGDIDLQEVYGFAVGHGVLTWLNSD